MLSIKNRTIPGSSISHNIYLSPLSFCTECNLYSKLLLMIVITPNEFRFSPAITNLQFHVFFRDERSEGTKCVSCKWIMLTFRFLESSNMSFLFLRFLNPLRVTTLILYRKLYKQRSAMHYRSFQTIIKVQGCTNSSI